MCYYWHSHYLQGKSRSDQIYRGEANRGPKLAFRCTPPPVGSLWLSSFPQANSLRLPKAP